MRALRPAFVALLLFAGPAYGATLDMQSVNDAQWSGARAKQAQAAPIVIKAQILLDRARFSPGEIDGKTGENFKKALQAFADQAGLTTRGELNEAVWQQLDSTSSDPVLVEYTISEDDVRGPFVPNIPTRLEEMQGLPSLGYKSAREKIAEKFHMSEQLLQTLNPGQTFDRAGDSIVVADVSGELPDRVKAIEIDKSARVLRVFGPNRMLLAVYPATIGSTEKPAPSGRLTVTRVSRNPTYRYNPKYEFKGVRTDKPFTIKPGPNNPVGVVWIALSAEGYGIHGTPDPGKVGKTESHGCVRLTNWDASHLASVVGKGVPVDFVGEERGSSTARAQARRGKSR